MGEAVRDPQDLPDSDLGLGPMVAGEAGDIIEETDMGLRTPAEAAAALNSLADVLEDHLRRPGETDDAFAARVEAGRRIGRIGRIGGRRPRERRDD